MDQKQLELENELSMLTYELSSPTPALKPLTAIRNSAIGRSPDRARRRLKAAEQDALSSYVQYRHSMRAIDRSKAQARLFSPSISSQKSSVKPSFLQLSDL